MSPAMSATEKSQFGRSLLDQDQLIAVQPPAAESLPPGLTEHPDYEVIRELGQGGMGTVYLAQNRMMGRLEVLKVVSRHMMNRRGVLDRFSTEIRNAARLHHTNIGEWLTCWAIVLAHAAVGAVATIVVLALSKVSANQTNLGL